MVPLCWYKNKLTMTLLLGVKTREKYDNYLNFINDIVIRIVKVKY